VGSGAGGAAFGVGVGGTATTGGAATIGVGVFPGELAGGGAGWFVGSDAG